jgi:hypothetical protein
MIPEMITSAYLSIGTNGYSESAQFISNQIALSQTALWRPEFYFSTLKKVLPDLMAVASDGVEGGWDGYDALPITKGTIDRATAFLESLPNSIQPPTVGAEPDGHITFEWYSSPHRLLSVSVSPEGDLHYAALIGHNRAYGTEMFLGDAPKEILGLIRRIDVV